VYNDLHGYWREWDEAGELTADETYRDGERVTGDAPVQNDAGAEIDDRD